MKSDKVPQKESLGSALVEGEDCKSKNLELYQTSAAWRLHQPLLA